MLKAIGFILLFRLPGDSVVPADTSMTLLDSMYTYIVQQQIAHPDIVMRQLILETGWLKDKKILKKNNVFGFRNKKGYITFESWKQCIEYYKSWQQARYANPAEDYYLFLKRVKYATGENYNRYLKKIKLPEKYKG